VRLLALTILSGACTLAWPVLAWLSTGRGDAYTATETAWRDGSLTPFAPWLSRSGWWVGPHLGPLLLAGILVVAAAALSAPSLRRLGPGAWFWCIAYVVYLLAFFDPTTSVFRILLPLAPVAWALAASLSLRRRILLLTTCVVGQLFWIGWVWDLSVRVTQWVP
jgi:integral membrane protein